MATKTEDKKIYEPETYDETPLPEAVIWEEIVDKPTTLAELSPADGSALAAASIAIDGLGDLAYEDLVTELNIANGAITNAKIAVDAIQGAVIAAGAITVTKISDGAIETGKLAANAVTAAKIAAGTITANEIAASTITAGKMNVSTLSAISANLGTINAGSISAVTITGSTITGTTLSTATSGQRVVLTSTLAQFYNSSGTEIVDTYASSNSYLIKGMTSSSSIVIDSGSSGAVVIANNGTNRVIIDGGSNRHMSPWSSGDMSLGNITSKWQDLWMNGDFEYRTIRQPVMYHGYVSGTSVFDYNDGASFSVSNGSTGIYTVTHNFGTTAYQVLITPFASTAKVWAVDQLNSNSFRVRIANTSFSLENNDFMFLLIKRA